MDAIQFLTREHQKAKAAFGKVLAAAPEQRGARWKELEPELKAHEEIEATCLYGPLEAEGPSDSKLLEWVSDTHEVEVEKVEALIMETERLEPTDERWLATVRQIHDALERHIRQEEDEVFPRIAQFWDQAKLAGAGEDMEAMMAEKATRH
jgi:iron-sulfur cluster repair protein YtfE (RIC family)